KLCSQLHQLCNGLSIPGHFHQFRTDIGHSLRIIQLQASRPSLFCQIARHVQQKLFLLLGCQSHLITSSSLFSVTFYGISAAADLPYNKKSRQKIRNRTSLSAFMVITLSQNSSIVKSFSRGICTKSPAFLYSGQTSSLYTDGVSPEI